MNYMAYDLPSESLWDDTAATLSHESSLRQSTLAAAAVEPLWPFLAAAVTNEEFQDRLAMSQPNLERMIATSLGDTDPSSYIREISGDFTQRFHQGMAERQATDKIAERLKTAGSYRDDPEVKAWYKERENVTYTDGTRVSEGDHIRYHQAPGGLMSPSDWRYGVAAYLPKDWNDLAANELHLLDDNGHYFGLYGHVVERADTKTSAKSDSCPECGSHMSNVTIKGNSLSATCDNCGWKGTKKKSAKTAGESCSGAGKSVGSATKITEGKNFGKALGTCPDCGRGVWVKSPNGNATEWTVPRHAPAKAKTSAATSGWLDAARKVVSGNTYDTVDGMLLDQFSASAMVQVYDSLSPDNQTKFAAMSLQAAHDLTFKMLAKQGAKTAAKGPLPEHLKEYWGNSTKDPRDDIGYCPKQSRKTPAIPWHNGSRTCLSCGKDMTKNSAKQADRTGPTIDSPEGYEYTPAPDWVQRACKRRFEGGGVTALDPKNPGHYLHGVGNWWDGPHEVKDNGDHTLSFTSPYDNQTDRFDETGYYDAEGNHKTSVKTAAAPQSFDGTVRNGLGQFLEQYISSMTYPDYSDMTITIDDKVFYVDLRLDTATGDDGFPVHGDVSGYYGVNGPARGEPRFDLGTFHISPGKPNGVQQQYAARNAVDAIVNRTKWMLPEGEQSWEHEWKISVRTAKYPYSSKTATRYCPTHKVYVGEGNQENHDHCPVETRKKKESATSSELQRGDHVLYKGEEVEVDEVTDGAGPNVAIRFPNGNDWALVHSVDLTPISKSSSLEDLGHAISRLKQMTSGFFRHDDAQQPMPTRGQPNNIEQAQYRNGPKPVTPNPMDEPDDHQADPSGANDDSVGKMAVNESADGAARYQTLPGVPTPAWIHDAWDLGKDTQQDLDQGRLDATPPNPFADSLTTTRDTRTFPHSPTSSKVPVDLARVRQSALRLAEVVDPPLDPEPDNNLAGTQQASGYDTSVAEQPKTSKPRQMPDDGSNQNLVTVQQDIIPAPVVQPFGDQGSSVDDQMGSGGGFDMGYAPQQDPMLPSTDQVVAAKVASLASRVRMDNPDLSPAQARAIAAQTVATYPEMIKG